MVRNEGEDLGFCLMGARTMRKNATALKKKIKRMKDGGDIEAVHQARVASRRIREDMPIFEPCFKVKNYKKWRSATKGVTKALGEIRDIDVQMDYLRSFLKRASSDEVQGTEALLALMQKERTEQQEHVMDQLDTLARKRTLNRTRSRLDKMVRRLEDRGVDIRSRTSYAACLAHVSGRTKDLLDLELNVHREEAWAEHHAMRIAAKHLRYTLEAFRGLFDDELEEEIEVMKGLQDLVGEMHDCDVWVDSIPDMISQLTSERLDEAMVRPGLEAIAQDRRTTRQQMYRQFVITWDKLRKDRFFEKTIERLQMRFYQNELGVPLDDIMHRPVRLALISDVHGNLDALNAVLDDARTEGVAAYLNMGDMVGFGAYSEEVVQKILSNRMLSIVGNFDLKVLKFAKASKKTKARAAKEEVVAVAARDLSEESMNYISSLPPEIRVDISGRRVFMVHSSPADPKEHLSEETTDPRLEEIGKVANSDIVMIGHSHKSLCRTVNGTMFVNPGSVGRPADHDTRASYAILDTKEFSVQLRRVEYDVEAAAGAVLEHGLPPEVAEMIRQGLSSQEMLEDNSK